MVLNRGEQINIKEINTQDLEKSPEWKYWPEKDLTEEECKLLERTYQYHHDRIHPGDEHDADRIDPDEVGQVNRILFNWEIIQPGIIKQKLEEDNHLEDVLDFQFEIYIDEHRNTNDWLELTYIAARLKVILPDKYESDYSGYVDKIWNDLIIGLKKEWQENDVINMLFQLPRLKILKPEKYEEALEQIGIDEVALESFKTYIHSIKKGIVGVNSWVDFARFSAYYKLMFDNERQLNSDEWEAIKKEIDQLQEEAPDLDNNNLFADFHSVLKIMAADKAEINNEGKIVLQEPLEHEDFINKKSKPPEVKKY